MKGIILILFIYAARGETFCLPPSTNSINHIGTDHLSLMENSANEFAAMAEKVLPAGEVLTITFESLNAGVNAEIIKSANGPVIRVLGGMLQLPEMNKDSFLLLLCHELGHYLGGPPLKSRNGWSSTEGQADYYSGESCVRYLNFTEENLLEGAWRLTKIYANVVRENQPRLDTCDENRVTRINYGYPKVQCRLDTIIAGWKNEKRPACWYYE